ITLRHASLKLDFGAWLRPAHRWITLRLSGMELRVEHAASGWQVVGFGNSPGETHAPLQSLPVDLDLSNLHVDIVDDATQRSWRLFAPHLRVVNVGAAVRFGGSVQQMDTQQAVTISGSMSAGAHDYALHVATHDLDLAEAVRGVNLHGYAVQGGRGDIERWGSWRDGKLASAAARYSIGNLAATGPNGRVVGLASLGGVLKVTRAGDGWDIAWRGPGKPRADIDAAGGAIAQVRGHAGAWRVMAAAHAVDVAPWLSLLAMAPQAPPAFAQWVNHARPYAKIDDAAIVWQQRGRYDATVRFSNLGAAATGAVPGIVLAQGTVRADDKALSL